MKLKKLVATACAAIAITGCVFFVGTHETDAAQANGVLTLEQLSADGYTGARCSMDGSVISTDDGTKYSVLMTDGSVYVLDNTSGKYGTLTVGTGSSDFNVLYSKNADGKTTLFNADGTYYGKLNGYYSIATLSCNSNNAKFAGSYFYTDDNGSTYFCQKDGTVIGTFHFSENVLNIIAYGNYFYVQTMSDEGIYDANGVIVPGFSSNIGLVRSIGENSLQWYKKVDDSYTGPEKIYYYKRPGKYIATYYNDKLETVTEEEWKNLALVSGRVHNYSESYKTVDASAYVLTGDYKAYGTYTIEDSIVVLGKATVQIDGINTTVKALFNTDGSLLLNNLYSTSLYKNVFVIKDGTNYKYIRLQKPTAENQTNGGSDNQTSSNTTSDNNSGLTQLKSDGNGNLTGSVVAGGSANEKFDFISTEKVIPAGSKFSVSKVISGQTFDAAKQVVQDVADKCIVYNIDLLNSENTKIEPDGSVQITLPAPEGYNTAHLAVYRLSDDGKTYIRLDSKVVDGKVIFVTDHFSTYLVTEEKVPVTSATDKAPTTGDRLPVNILLMCIGIASVTIIVSARRKKSIVK